MTGPCHRAAEDGNSRPTAAPAVPRLAVPLTLTPAILWVEAALPAPASDSTVGSAVDSALSDIQRVLDAGVEEGADIDARYAEACPPKEGEWAGSPEHRLGVSFG